ncbi:MAG TPA: type II secretion system protein [Mesotoga infera]|uniref:Type II secretion system protein n=1 Tax=Mesotoga infera TaxID=1236046 RepID=A0A7C1CUS3_9BACT|nr:type II secretion system protein [Mesotoga infera]
MKKGFTLSEIVIVMAIIALLMTSGISLIIQYRGMSARLEVVTNLHSAKLMVEGIVRSTNRVSEANIISRIQQLSEYPGFEEVTVVSVDATSVGDTPTKRVFRVVLKDERVSREEEFYVYRFDPYAE